MSNSELLETNRAMPQRNYLTIVSGLPRSGTSMMMQMINQGGIPALVDDQRPPDDDNPRGYYEFQPVKRTREDPSWLDDAFGKVVKMVHLLLLDLPLDRPYRVVLMRRNLLEVVRSQNVMLTNMGRSVEDLPPERIIDAYHLQIAKVRRHLERNAQCFRYMEADYNELVQNPGPCLEKIGQFLDGLDVARMQVAIEPRLYRNRQACEAPGRPPA